MSFPPLKPDEAPKRIRKLLVGADEERRLSYVVKRLRERDLSFRSIAVVLDVYEGYEGITEEEIRLWCRRLGMPRKRPEPETYITNVRRYPG